MRKKKILHPKRNAYLTRHHILAKERQGVTVPHNILRLWSDKHASWHQIFNNRTIAEILQRFSLYRFYRNRPQWKLIFGNKTDDQCKELLERVFLIKNRLRKRR